VGAFVAGGDPAPGFGTVVLDAGDVGAVVEVVDDGGADSGQGKLCCGCTRGPGLVKGTVEVEVDEVDEVVDVLVDVVVEVDEVVDVLVDVVVEADVGGAEVPDGAVLEGLEVSA
jgi:hypothetical protein